MRSRTTLSIYFVMSFFLLLQGTGVHAEEPSLRLTLQEAVRLAREHNFDVAGAALEIASNEAERVTAGLIPNPQLSVNDNFINPRSPRVGSQLSARVEQLFETFGKRRYRTDSADQATKSSHYRLADTIRQRTLEVKVAFYHLLLAQEHLRLARDNSSRFQEILRINIIRFEKGDISEAELMKIRLQQVDFQNDVILATVELQGAERELKFLLVLDPSKPLEVVGELKYQAVEINLDSLTESAFEMRPDLHEKRSNLKKAESDIRLSRSMRFPDVAIGVEFDTIGPDYHGLVGAGVSLPLPIFNRNQGEIRKAEVSFQNADILLKEKRHQIGLEVEYAYREFLQDRAQVSIFESGPLQDAKSSREIAENAYKKGGSSVLDLLEAERTFNATLLNYDQALFNYQKSLFQLESISGKEIIQ